MSIERAPTRWALALLTVLLSACGGSDPQACSPTDPACDPGGGNGTPDALTITQVSPSDGASGVATDATVTITFSRAVAPASVTSTSVTLGSVAGTRDVSGSTVTFTPDAGLAEGTSYTVTVNGVTDAEGVGLDGSFSSAFTTVSSPAMADAGMDMTITAGDEASFDGSASTGSGATYTWTVLEGPALGPLDGQTPTFTAPDEIGKMVVELSVAGGSSSDADTVNVWILEDAGQALWVSSSGSDANPGTREAPMATLQAAIDASDAAGNGADVYVAGGEYAESLTLRSRVSLYGGWDDTDWSRDVASHRPIVTGSSTAIQATEANDLTIEGLAIVATDATESSGSSIAVFLRDSNGVTMRDNIVTAGAGVAGVNGTAGAAYTSRADNGSGGTDSGFCDNPGGAGGSGGPGSNGGGGGSGGFYGGFAGGGGAGPAGDGGSGGSTYNSGGRGDPGSDNQTRGPSGSGGEAFGSFDANGYLIANGVSGTNGGVGAGGGGGGGGGGNAITACGGGGGGGGEGGAGGRRGTRGWGGGGSFGVVLYGVSTAILADNVITTSDGGAGGEGGSGGAGQSGGFGGSGGDSGTLLGAGGNGGTGGRGAPGGHGGGGGGGPTIGVVEDTNASVTLSGNTITMGTPGGGGISAGNAGSDGEASEHKKVGS